MSGSFSKNIFDYRGNRFQMITKTTINSIARMARRPPRRLLYNAMHASGAPF